MPQAATVAERLDGQHVLLYRATDSAGNGDTLKSAVLKIDGT